MLAAFLLLATDDTPPGTPWIMDGGSHFQKKLPGSVIERYRPMAEESVLEQKIVRLPCKTGLFDLNHGRVTVFFLPASSS